MKHFYSVKDMYNRFKDLMDCGYGDYPVSFDIGGFAKTQTKRKIYDSRGGLT